MTGERLKERGSGISKNDYSLKIQTIMHQKTFIIALTMVIGSFAIMIFSSTSHDTNLYPVGMGLMIFGGILLAVSKAEKNASSKGGSILDELIEMLGNPTPKSKTKNINIDGDGNIVDSYKKNTTTNEVPTPKYKSMPVGEEEIPFNTSLKDLIATNKSSECLEQMREHFKSNDNKTALKAVIQLRSRLRENDDRYDSGLINDELRNREKDKIRHAILNLIDHEISA